MEKKSVVRWQLIALAGITGLLLFRVISGPPAPDGLIVLDDIGPNELHERAFSLEGPASLRIHAVGAYDHREDGQRHLAASAWILDRVSRRPVWVMEHGVNAVPTGRGLLAQSDDTLQLSTGTYEVYFASYGGLLSGASASSDNLLERLTMGRQRWQDDARRWQLVISDMGTKRENATPLSIDDIPAVIDTGEIWAGTGVRNAETRHFLFQVDEPREIRVLAVGEMASEPSDYGWIENLETGEKVWEMTPARTMPAGGAVENRVADETVTLAPGLYRATYRADRTHAYGDWLANPPFDPGSWGLRLTAAPGAAANGAIRSLDPRRDGVALVSLDRVGNDALRAAYFTVDQPAMVMIDGMGELTEYDRFDFGWLERLSPAAPRRDPRETHPDPGATVWEMQYDASEHAGGSDDNREQFDLLRLSPGAYVLYYRSDYAHAFGDWRRDHPLDPERWGIALYALRADAPPTLTVQEIVRIDLDDSDGEEDLTPIPDVPPLAAPPPAAFAPLAPIPGEPLVTFAPLGSGVSQEHTFELSGKTVLRIRALGEISLSGGLYDYGQIVRQDDGTVVWRMSRENTVPAGGDNANRFFDGDILLEAGRYVARFETDATHAYGDFDNDPPDHPEAWGMVIYRLPSR
jgi:hypothetical protein